MRRLGAILLVILALFGVVPLTSPPLTAAPLTEGLAQLACGVERWPVKTLSDNDVGRVNFTPVRTRVADLVALPHAPSKRTLQRMNRTRVRPVELQTYTVTAFTVQARLEDDSDIHLVIEDVDDPSITMIVEFPDADNCALDTAPALVSQMRAARDAFVHTFGVPPRTRFLPVYGKAEISGVAFYDFYHNQTGVARNVIELHPILSFQPVP